MDNITCDACKKEFSVKPDTIRNRQSGELLFRYMKCPHCEAAFLISASDKRFRKALNRNTMTADQARMIQNALNELYFPRFAELFPTAYRQSNEEGL